MAKQNFYKELNLRKTNIGLQSINLSVLGDANMLFTETEEWKAMTDGVFSEYQKNLKGIRNVVKNVGSAIDNVEKLMVNADKFLNETRQSGQTLMDMLDGATKLQREVENTLDKIEKSAKNLGLKPDDIDIYKKLVVRDNAIEGYIDNIAKLLDVGRETIDDLISESRKLNKISSIE